MMLQFIFLVSLLVAVQADLSVPSHALFTSPAPLAKHTSPNIKTWASHDFLNPIAVPQDLAATMTKRVSGSKNWLALTLYWTGDTAYDAMDFSEYQVWRRQDSGGFSMRGFVTGANAHSFVDDKSVFGSTYQYKIRLVTDIGMGPFSDVLEVTTPEAPEGYVRPGSQSSPSRRMKALRAKITLASPVETAKTKKAETEKTPVVETSVETPLPTQATTITTTAAPSPATEAPKSPETTTTTTTPAQSIWTTTAKSHPGESDWVHMVRVASKKQNATKHKGGKGKADCSSDGVARGLCTDAGGAWYFETLLSKILGSAEASSSL